MSVLRPPALLRPAVVIRPIQIGPIRPVCAPPTIVRQPADFETDASPSEAEPFEDYGRTLTPEGGVLIFFKDLDLRLRQIAWRILAWAAFTGAEAVYLNAYAPTRDQWTGYACLIAVGIANWLVLRKPSECHRWVEIRPDCLIIEGADVFWRRYMEAGPPAFQADDEGNQQLRATYGTRLVELLTVRRFDELDRTPEVIAAHLQAAFQQLWENSTSKAGLVSIDDRRLAGLMPSHESR